MKVKDIAKVLADPNIESITSTNGRRMGKSVWLIIKYKNGETAYLNPLHIYLQEQYGNN